MALNAKQQAFVQEYLKDKNATQAYIRAGYEARGNAAEVSAARLLRNAQIKEAIDAGLEDAAERNGLTVDLLLSSLVREIKFDPAQLYNDDGSLKAIKDMDEDTRRVLSEVTMTQVGSPDAPLIVTKVKWTQPHQAREQGMRYRGMYAKDNRQQGDAAAAAVAEAVREFKTDYSALRGTLGNGGKR